MNDDIKSLMDNLLSPDNVQAKVDILESNISGDFIKSEDELEGELTIKRDGTGAVNNILEKAVKQFLETLNIPESLIGSELIDALEGKIDESEDETINIQLSFRDHTENKQTRKIEIIVRETEIKLNIKGYPAVPQKDEAITEYYFEHEQYPGKVLANGKFDFRELHKFPSVKEHDKLLFISYPVEGKAGVTCTGRHLSVEDAKNLNLQISSGIIKEEVSNEEEKHSGYFFKASTNGVVILKKSKGEINEIGVSKEVKLDKIDFSTGNIGTEFKSPVSMEIGIIDNEFNVNVDGNIKVENLNGGKVSTNDNAITGQVRSNSIVKAKNNITAKTVADSSLESLDGTILVENETRDSKLKAPKVHFTCTTKGLMLNNTINTCICNFTGAYYCGVNTIILGKELFQKRLELIESKEPLEKTNSELQTAVQKIKASLVPELKELSTQIKDNNIMNMFKLLIRCFQALEFNDAFKVLANLRQSLNVMQIDSIKKSLSNLQKLSIKIVELEDKMRKNNEIFSMIEKSINDIKFQISGEINHRGTIKIFCSKNPKENQPVFEIMPASKTKNEKINISGRYTLKDGFIVN